MVIEQPKQVRPVGKGSPDVTKRFKKGVSGNPKGRARMDPELRKIKNLTRDELVEMGTIIVKGNIDDLIFNAKKHNATVLTVMLSAVCRKIIAKGDMHALNELLNRLIGPVPKDMPDIYNNFSNSNAQVIVTLPTNNREAKVV